MIASIKLCCFWTPHRYWSKAYCAQCSWRLLVQLWPNFVPRCLHLSCIIVATTFRLDHFDFTMFQVSLFRLCYLAAIAVLSVWIRRFDSLWARRFWLVEFYPRICQRKMSWHHFVGAPLHLLRRWKTRLKESSLGCSSFQSMTSLRSFLKGTNSLSCGTKNTIWMSSKPAGSYWRAALLRFESFQGLYL